MSSVAEKKEPKIVIIGSGPCGLGAAYRLQEVGHENFVMLDAAKRPGGLARSDVDENGFYWDYGGHVVFSHYKYFDKVLDQANSDWVNHQREAWVWMRDRWVPYPFQNNIQRLPAEELSNCVKGLIDKEPIKNPKNFREWLHNGFGKGIMDSFLVPYNRKVWGYDPTDMNVEWMGERVATVDVGRVVDNIISGEDDVGWGPNATFRFPLKGGTGAIWDGVYDLIDKKHVELDATVTSVDAEAKKLTLANGKVVEYDHLISTMPLDHMCEMVKGEDFAGFKDLSPKFRYSSTNIIGLGMEGKCPKHLRDKCWMYFPEDNCPFYRVTVFSKYSPYHVPKVGEQWSLMFEVCETEMRPVNHDTILQEVIDGAIATKLISPSSKIVTKYYRRFEHGYPTPFAGRDQLCKPIFDTLEKHDIYSRGRFGAWKYEVSNQDHTMMQGVEAADHILFGMEEMTFRFPGVVNRRDWKDVGRMPRAPPKEIHYHDPEEIERKALMDKYGSEEVNKGEDANPGEAMAMGKLENCGTNINRVILVDMETAKADGGVEALTRLTEAGNEVFLVASPEADNSTNMDWVKKSFGQDWAGKVLMSKDPTVLQGHIFINSEDKPAKGAVAPSWRHMKLSDWKTTEADMPARIPLSIKDKTNLYPNGINFSAVLPTFNQYDIVRKTLCGLVKQKIVSDFKLEVIIVDNNSTDDIQKIYMDYRDKLDLRLIQRRKLENTFSVPSARNMGILEAKYDYILGMDSDVIFDENALENLYQFLSSQDPSTPFMVTAERWFVNTEPFQDEEIMKDFKTCEKFEKILSKANYFKPRDNRFSHGKVLHNIENNVHPYAYFYGMHTAFPRAIWEAIQGYNEVYDGWWGYDDIEFAYRMIVDGGCVPVVLAGTEVYHQEPYGSEWVPIGGVVNKDGTSNPRLNKAANPNWQRICETIPGYAEWKKDHYQRLAGDIVTL